MTVRYAQDHLSALGAHRLIRWFKGDAAAAFAHYTRRLEALQLRGQYVSAKEMKRAAARVPLAINGMFRLKSGKAG